MALSEVEAPPESLASCRDVMAQLQSFSGSDNRLVNLSAELLAILTTLSMAKSTPNINELYNYLKRSVSEVHSRGLQSEYSPRTMEKLCYLLCAALDEEVMKTWWGQNLCWENHSLVAGMFQQRNAGEVFFILVNQALQEPDKMRDFLEVAYLLMRLGFHGRYLNSDNRELVDLTDILFREIQVHRIDPRIDFPSDRHAAWLPIQQKPVRFILISAFIILLLTGIGSHLWIRHINQLSDDNLVPLLNEKWSVQSDNKSPVVSGKLQSGGHGSP
ncbi:type IVB secretion system protein IcmH/DotU [Endozoicomonas arenosclerae]|uniref:type IVB secretion system protein IcmH/DotU n=1 Tax=Endozoicomonas arenosclerae TaxID=1633495 RepID=UPI000B31BED9|nr:type IVB secretion system protein IcmH/DotU [Endozoicomonas arenosclerae]